MTAGNLIDAGPIVAMLHADDQDHATCVETFKCITGPVFTTWMPVTEAMYLLGFSLRAQESLLRMLQRQAIRILPIDLADPDPIAILMNKYKDLPMHKPGRQALSFAHSAPAAGSRLAFRQL